MSQGDLWVETSEGVSNQHPEKDNVIGWPTARTLGKVMKLRVRANDRTEKKNGSYQKPKKKISAQHPCNVETGPPPSSICYPSPYKTEKHPS